MNTIIHSQSNLAQFFLEMFQTGII